MSTSSFFAKRATEDTFEEMKRMGVPVCETFLASYSEYLPSFIRKLNERKGNIEVKSIHAMTQQFEPDLFNRVERARKESEKILKKVAKAGELLDARCYTFHGPAILKKLPFVLDYERIGKRTEELCAFVRKESGEKVSLCYENVHWCYFQKPDFFTRITEYSPSVKACLDVKQALLSGFSPMEYLKVMNKRLTNVHLCDYNDTRTFLPGKGSFDFSAFFDALLDSGYTGDAMMEVYPGDYQNFGELEQSFNYLNECLYQVQR